MAEEREKDRDAFERESLDVEGGDPAPLDPDALNPEHETIPVKPARRRFQIGLGLVFMALIVGMLLWSILRARKPEERTTGSIFSQVVSSSEQAKEL